MSSHLRWISWLCGVLLASNLVSACNVPSSEAPQTSSKINPDWIALHVSQEGVYRISASEMRDAGLGLESFEADSLVIWQRGHAIPFLVADQGAAVLFYATSPASPYSAYDTYWLMRTQDRDRIIPYLQLDQSGAHVEAVTKPPEVDWPTGAADRVVKIILLEENSLYTPQVEQGDRWLWKSLSAPYSWSLEFDMPTSDGGPGRLQVRAWARTEAPGPIDHHWEFVINDQFVGDEQWDGRGVHIFELSIPAGVLKSGKNRLELQALDDLGLKADIVYIDRIELEYVARPEPDVDTLVFQAAGDTLKVDGFTGPIAGFMLGVLPQDAIPVGIFTQADNLSVIPGQRYWLSGPKGYLTPAEIRPGWIDSELLSASQAAHYLAIGPADLLAPLSELFELRSSQGLTTRAINVEAIYNQFNGGFPEPEAIQHYIQYTAQHWPSAPRYVLLVGDSTYDMRGYLSAPDVNRLPVFLVDTIFGGQTASDIPFSLLDEDELPDLAVGRIPAQTPQQVRKVVNKILAYEAGLANQKTSSILAIADGQDPNFAADANRFLEQFPAPAATQLVQPQAGSNNAAEEVLQAIQGGHWLVSYFGHGSIDMWGRDRLLTTADVAQLDDPTATTILLNMTCLTGFFVHPQTVSLAEAMLFQEPGGAVLVLAPSSLTLPGDQGFLSRALSAALINSDEVVIGDVLLTARRSIPLDSPGTRDVLLTFLLFGDPATRVR